MQSEEPLLAVRGLRKCFRSKSGAIEAVNNVSFEIRRGESFALVGESGSGKSTIARTIIRLYAPSAGQIVFEGRDISGRIGRTELSFLRTGMQMIFQDPASALNPRRTVRELVAAGLDINHLCASPAERDRLVFDILEQVGLSSEQAERYPQQFSGGQKQRIGIARALVMGPSLIIADEPVSALDVSIQAQIINLLRRDQKDRGTSYLFISHDLAVVRYIADRIGVLHRGHLVECGQTTEIFASPTHPYTKALFSAIPRPNPLVERLRQSLSYDYQSSGIDYTKGDYRQISPTHQVLATEREFETWV
jgi:oligopeptide transport system ATP-binding protein